MRALVPFLAAMAVTGCARHQPTTSIAMRPTCGTGANERPCPFTVALAWDSAPPVPTYPRALLAAGMKGVVTLHFGVDSSGRVDPATIAVQSSSMRSWVEPVTEAVARWIVAVPRNDAAGAAWRQQVTVRFEGNAPGCPIGLPLLPPVATWRVTPDPVLTITGCSQLVRRDQVRPAPARP